MFLGAWLCMILVLWNSLMIQARTPMSPMMWEFSQCELFGVFTCNSFKWLSFSDHEVKHIEVNLHGWIRSYLNELLSEIFSRFSLKFIHTILGLWVLNLKLDLGEVFHSLDVKVMKDFNDWGGTFPNHTGGEVSREMENRPYFSQLDFMFMLPVVQPPDFWSVESISPNFQFHVWLDRNLEPEPESFVCPFYERVN